MERGERTKGFLQLSEILLRGLTWKFHLTPLYLDQNIVTATPGLGKVFILGNNVSSKMFAKGKGGWNNGSQLAIIGDFFTGVLFFISPFFFSFHLDFYLLHSI